MRRISCFAVLGLCLLAWALASSASAEAQGAQGAPGAQEKKETQSITGDVTDIAVAGDQVTLKIGEKSLTLPAKVALTYSEKKKVKTLHALAPAGQELATGKKETKAASGTIVSGETGGRKGPKFVVEISGTKTPLYLPGEVVVTYAGSEIQSLRLATRKETERAQPAP